jgi:hypothetical protein
MADDVQMLADALRQEMPGAWLEIKKSQFPGDPNDPDQQVLFLALARGLLKYLTGRTDLIAQMDLTPVGVGKTVTVANLQLKISGL